MNLTKEQSDIIEFVRTGKGSAIIDAVAGAGKTSTILECSKYLQNQNTTLFCAFNKSIAEYIKSKFKAIQRPSVRVYTIHSLGLQILQSTIFKDVEYKVVPDKYKAIIKSDELFEELKDKLEEISKSLYNQSLSNNKENADKIYYRLLEIADKYRLTLTNSDFDSFKSTVEHYNIFNENDEKNKSYSSIVKLFYDCNQRIIEFGNNQAKNEYIIDYSDMVYLPHYFKLFPQYKYAFIFIDECQDLSKSQVEIVMKYKRPNGRVLSVGDPFQSIYGFSGADIQSFENLKTITNAKVLPLTHSFRCPKKSIEMAKEIRSDIVGVKENEGQVIKINSNEVIKYVKAGDLVISRLKSSLYIGLFDFIIAKIKVSVNEDDAKDVINDFRNLFTKNELTLNTENYFGSIDSLMETVLLRHKSDIDKKSNSIKDQKVREDFVRVQNLYLESKIELLLKLNHTFGSEEIFECVNDMLTYIRNYMTSQENAVLLSTIHRAKGLENETVFILDYANLPFDRTFEKEWQKRQELNLKYVAITRTLNKLYLVNDNSEEEQSLTITLEIV